MDIHINMKISSTCLTNSCIFICSADLSFAETKLMIMICFLGLSQTSWTKDPLFLHNPCSALPWVSLPPTPPFPLPPNCFPPALTGLSLSPTPNNYARLRLLLRIHTYKSKIQIKYLVISKHEMRQLVSHFIRESRNL